MKAPYIEKWKAEQSVTKLNHNNFVPIFQATPHLDVRTGPGQHFLFTIQEQTLLQHDYLLNCKMSIMERLYYRKRNRYWILNTKFHFSYPFIPTIFPLCVVKQGKCIVKFIHDGFLYFTNRYNRSRSLVCKFYSTRVSLLYL